MDGRNGRMTKGAKKRATRKRRQEIARMHASGRTPFQIARLLRCSAETVRQHVTAIREAARQRMVSEWGPSAAETGDLIEGIEDALQKVRAAQGDADPAKSTHRGLLQLELKTLREMIDLRRELAAARTQANADAPGGWGGLEHLSNEEMIEQARDLGIDTSAFEQAVRLGARGTEQPASAEVPDEKVESLTSNVSSCGERDGVTSREERVPPRLCQGLGGQGPECAVPIGCDERTSEVGSDVSGPRAVVERASASVTGDRGRCRSQLQAAGTAAALVTSDSPLASVSSWCPIMREPDERR